MQAVTFEQLGGPEALRLREIDEPQLRANQVLVRVQAVAVDHVDTFVRSGAFQTALATPHVVGRDLVGTVLRVAADNHFTFDVRQFYMAQKQISGFVISHATDDQLARAAKWLNPQFAAGALLEDDLNCQPFAGRFLSCFSGQF